MWRVLAAPSTLLILAALLAVALVLGALIPQVPADLAGDGGTVPAREFVGPSNGLLQTLGLRDVYHAIGFRLLLALAGLAVFCAVVESAELAWRATRSSWTASSLGLWGPHPLYARLPAADAPAEAEVQVKSILAGHDYRWAAVDGPPEGNAVAGRGTVLWWAQPAAFAGLLLALLGLAIVATFGWQTAEWRPAVGESYVIGHGTDYTLRLEGLQPPLPTEAGGGTGSYESRLGWLQDGRTVHEGQVAINRPVTWHGLAVRQVGLAPAVSLRGQDRAGRPLLFQSAEEIANPAEEVAVVLEPAETQHLVLIGNQGFFLLLSPAPVAGNEQPGLRVEMIDPSEGEQQVVGILADDGVLPIDGVQVEFDIAIRPVLRVDYRPGMGLVVGGLVLAVVALAVGWLFPPRLLWLAAAPTLEGPALVHVLGLGGAGQARWFSRLVAQLREALVHDA